MNRKEAGVLMPLASVPTKYGIGDFGPAAWAFAEKMRDTGFSLWQLLPLNPLGEGNSPYQPMSSAALDEIYVSLTLLKQQGLIKELPVYNDENPERIEYEKVRAFKHELLKEAASVMVEDEAFLKFAETEWVRIYALYMVMRKENGRDWSTWNIQPEDLLKQPIGPNERLIIRMQYILYSQYELFRTRIHELGLSIVGDLPFYPGLDSDEVWSERENFLLNSEGRQLYVAGVPGDYFNELGQRWGNPVYNWDYLKETGYEYWVERIRHCAQLYDRLRIDHFRAFDTWWRIPADSPTALEGEWQEAPGYEVLGAIIKAVPEIRLCAEDLGYLRKEVLELRDYYHLPGMRVIQYDLDNGFPQYPENLYLYTGTHDNMPLQGWIDSMGDDMRNRIEQLVECEEDESLDLRLIHRTLNSEANTVILSITDLLGLNEKARLNTPGTCGDMNWTWKLNDLSAYESRRIAIKELIRKTGR